VGAIPESAHGQYNTYFLLVDTARFLGFVGVNTVNLLSLFITLNIKFYGT
jgi:hypothetical protein